MSELQMGLLAIGVIIVVAVLAYNKWQEVRYRRLAEQNFGSGHEDVLLRPGQAPVLGESVPVDGVSRHPEHSRIEPSLIDPSVIADAPDQPDEPNDAVDGVAGDAPAKPGLVEPAEAIIDEAIDYVIEFRTDVDVGGSQVIDAAVKRLTGFTKPVNLEGFDESGGGWTPLSHAHQRQLLRVGLQLVDRHGVLSAPDMDRFAKAVYDLAVLAGARADAPDLAEVARRAQLLDQFCGDVDIQIALNVVPDEGLFSGTQIRALAESAGFMLESDGRFRRRNEQGDELFVLSNAGNTPFLQGALQEMETAALMFEFDVPRVSGGVNSFNQLARIAGQFASTLGGRLVDDNRANLTPASLAAIGKQLESIYASMSDQGIPAGSPRALRLFS